MVGRIFRNFSLNEITQTNNGTLSIGRITGIPNINSPQPPGNISTWFLGTRAEKGDSGKGASFAIGNDEPVLERVAQWRIVFRRDYRNSPQ